MGLRWRPILMAALLVLPLVFPMQKGQALRLNNRSLTQATDAPNAVTKYKFSFDYETDTTLGSIVVLFCTNSPLPNDACDPPPGLDVSQANLIEQTGETGFAVDSSSTPSKLVMSRVPSVRTAITQTFEFDNMVNPSANGTYFARISSHASNDGSGPTIDYGGIVFFIANIVTVRAEVPPYLIFCAAKTISSQNCTNIDGSTVDFNELSSRSANVATSQFQVTTNAGDGYNVRVAGPTMTSGNDIIAALDSSSGSAPGTAQFGFNLRRNGQPAVGRESQGGTQGQPMPNYNVANSFRYVPGEVIASAPRNDASQLYTVAYLVNIPPSQPAGLYVTTLTYICLANF